MPIPTAAKSIAAGKIKASSPKNGQAKGKRKAKPAAAPEAAEDRRELPIASLLPSPTNPRRAFTQEALDSLAASIKKLGIGQPLLVRPHAKQSGKFEIVAGERRFRAAKLAGLKTVPVSIRDLSDQDALEFQMIENLERESLNPIEEAIGFEQLVKASDLSERDLAARLGVSQGHMSNRIRLLKLPAAWQQKVISQEISVTEARDLCRWSERPQVLAYVAKEWKKGHFRGVEGLINRALTECSRPMSGGFSFRTKAGVWEYATVALSKKDAQREELDVENVKDLGKRAFNLPLWEELQAAGEARKKTKSESKGKAEASLSPAEAKRKAEQKKRQWLTRLYRYKVAWLQKKIVQRIAGPPAVKLPLLLRAGLRLIASQSTPHEPLIEAINAAGGHGKHNGSLHNEAWSMLQSIPDDRVALVLTQLVQACVQMDAESYRSPFRAKDIEGLAADLAIDIAAEWRQDEEFLKLHTKDQLLALASEWKVPLPGILGSKRGEILKNLWHAAREAKCPKELAALKPQF